MHVSVVKTMQLNFIVIFILIVAFTIVMITTVVGLTDPTNHFDLSYLFTDFVL